jgi:hypothetical protein
MPGQSVGGKKTPGQPFQTTAKQWNDLVEAAEWVKAHKGATSLAAGSPREWKRRSGIVKVKNVGANDRSQFEIVGITDSIFDPGVAATLAEYKREPSLQVRRPTCDHVSRFAVLLEPCNAGDIADAVISGVVQCLVNVTDADDDFADIVPDDSTQLESVAVSGSAQIMVREFPGSTGPMWCLVRLSNNLPFTHADCVSTSTTIPPTTTPEPTTPTTTIPPPTTTDGTGTTIPPTTDTTGTGTTIPPGTTTNTTGTTGTGTTVPPDPTTTGTTTPEPPVSTTTPEPGTTTGTTGTTTPPPGTTTDGTGTTGTGTTGTVSCPSFLCSGDCQVSFEVVTDVTCTDGSIVVTKATLCMSTNEVDLPDPVTTTGGA